MSNFMTPFPILNSYKLVMYRRSESVYHTFRTMANIAKSAPSFFPWYCWTSWLRNKLGDRQCTLSKTRIRSRYYAEHLRLQRDCFDLPMFATSFQVLFGTSVAFLSACRHHWTPSATNTALDKYYTEQNWDRTPVLGTWWGAHIDCSSLEGIFEIDSGQVVLNKLFTRCFSWASTSGHARMDERT